MNTNIHLHLNAPGVELRTVLKPEALAEILAFIQKYRVEAAEGPDACRPEGRPQALHGMEQIGGGGGGGWRPERPHRPQPNVVSASGAKGAATEASEAAKQVFASMDFALIRERLPNLPFESALVVLVGYCEARSGNAVHFSQIRLLLSQSGYILPSNPSRDLRAAFGKGLMLEYPMRKFITLTDAGWRLAQQGVA